MVVSDDRGNLKPDGVSTFDVEEPAEVSMPVEHGWLIDGRFLCHGCGVREGHEHRCFRNDAGMMCTCEECREADRLFPGVR